MAALTGECSGWRDRRQVTVWDDAGWAGEYRRCAVERERRERGEGERAKS